MISKREVKYIQSLCQKKQRLADRLFLVEGEKPVDELLKSSWTIRQIYATPEWIAARAGLTVPVTVVNEGQIQEMSALVTARSVIALVEMQEEQPAIAEIPGITLVLDAIQNPGNFGTIVRIADWFGVRQIIASENCADMYNPKVIQASMGSFVRILPIYTDLQFWLQQYPYPIMGAVLNGNSIYEVAPVQSAALIIGNEGKGIRDALLPLIKQPVSIPRMGGAESLNAAVATGILLSHLIQPV
ncbi:MAG: RNA methyltransferase [Sediminibacterium sp.]|nr:RNA methyltransferase [Sediminibacterium sp.]